MFVQRHLLHERRDELFALLSAHAGVAEELAGVLEEFGGSAGVDIVVRRWAAWMGYGGASCPARLALFGGGERGRGHGPHPRLNAGTLNVEEVAERRAD